ncbi:MAG TPA: HAD-IA family hydrolase [Candidatus Saccharimonadales bacterium]|nr:HAD-IA family hydrolase [Candidatus Saccharimonadales bacterium]
MESSGSTLDEKTLGKRLQTARQKAGLTQQALCQRANLSYSTLAKIERGAIKSPSIFTIQSIAGALGTSLDELVGAPTVSSESPKQVSKSGVRFVYFDLNDCLVRFYHHAFANLAGEAGVSSDVVETIFWRYNDAVCRGDMSVDQLNTALAERLHIMVDWNKYYLAAVQTMPGMADLVQWVAERYRLGVFTNTMPGLVDAMLASGALPRAAYDAIIDSSVVHALKPEPQAYEIAAARAGVAAQEILLIDDNRANLAEAGAQGWNTLWFNAYQPDESVKAIQAALEPAV